MAIGIDASRAFSEQSTGIGVYATEVCRGLIQDPPAPLTLYLNRRRPPALPELAPGSRWRPLPLPRGWTALRLALEVRLHPPELLFVPAYRLPPGPLPRSVVTVHGLEHKLAPAAYPGSAGRAVDRFVVDSLARASRLITPSETTRSDLVHFYGADPSRITVIAHGLAGFLSPRPAQEVARERRRLELDGPYFLVVGAHHRRKNVPFLVRAFAAAFPPSSGAPGPRLVVTNATGAAQQELSQLGQRLGLGDRLRLLPHVGGERLACLYSGALAACVPSLYEGFGLPALEAMACATPVLGSDVGGVRELASGAAMLVEVGAEQEWAAALSRLAGDEPLRRHLAELGRVRAQRYSWARSVAEHSRLLAAELDAARAGQRR